VQREIGKVNAPEQGVFLCLFQFCTGVWRYLRQVENVCKGSRLFYFEKFTHYELRNLLIIRAVTNKTNKLNAVSEKRVTE